MELIILVVVALFAWASWPVIKAKLDEAQVSKKVKAAEDAAKDKFGL
jgi:hypothetical protein